ncbi:MAG TPA: tRNA lysidine(34) synthetase TilS [Ohtaekwangia sp.]|nr:tRNA lysidine(34) synthetase TilS [Ohtaekwangia sp.]
MLKQFLNHIDQHKLFHPADRVLLAISGGVDSMVMLGLFKEAGFQVGVAHCNFQLRGADAAGDEDFIKTACAALGVPFFVTRFDTQAYASQNHLSIQMAARELRYTWFTTLMNDHAYQYLATAHHLNDAIETTVLNLVHGSGVEGLSGIPVRNNKTIRPLLFASRVEIERYAKENKIDWREDRSNATDDYQRNFIRHHIVPKLKEINPSLDGTLSGSLAQIKGEAELANLGAAAWQAKHVQISGDRTVIGKAGFNELRQGAVMLWRTVRTLGFNYDTCVDAIASLDGQPGKRFLSPSHQMVLDRHHFIVTPHADFWKDTIIQEGQSDAFLGPWAMRISMRNDVTPSSESNEAVLDAGKLRFPLVWRQWKPGDTFYPLGMEHSKKLSDFLIDNKVSVADKGYVTVLQSMNEIIWVVGYRVDNRYRITNQTTQAIVFSIRPYFV